MYAAIKHRDIANERGSEGFRVTTSAFPCMVNAKGRGKGGRWDRNPSLTVHNNPSGTRTSVITGRFFGNANLSSTAIDT